MAPHSGPKKKAFVSNVPSPDIVLSSVQMADDQNLTLEEGAGDAISKEEDSVDAKLDSSPSVQSFFR